MFSTSEKEGFLSLSKKILESGSQNANAFSVEIANLTLAIESKGMNSFALLEDTKTGAQLTVGGAVSSVDVVSELLKIGFVFFVKESLVLQLEQSSFGVFVYSISHPSIQLIMEAKEECEDLLSRVFSGCAGVDDLTPMVYRMSIYNRRLDIFRAYGAYLHQVKFVKYSDFISSISSDSKILESLLFVFEEKFEPNRSIGDTAMIQVVEELESVIGRCKNPETKTNAIMLLSVMNATVRTNFFCHDGQRSYISMKIQSNVLPGISKPHMFAEIFVYSYLFEGIHLRGGKVARGGLRWSDRNDDFRTEVFALVKTQILKNSLIVPTGSKGGFILKSQTRDKKFVVDCYQNFLRGMLDVTDNVVDGNIIHPKNVICFDEKDPYLVVAADKGTASFSDYANKVSEEYNFWLGDAFASGGSNGYSHKDIGITARGVWESVKQHFISLNIDPFKQEFTVIGIGSMNGDVFGNGMIYTNKIKLLAAFSNKSIFIDPNPNPIVSFEERKRLFAIPESSWSDYDPSKLSSGGMIVDRDANSVDLSLEVRKLLGIPDGVNSIYPEEVIRKILVLPVDLFYSGGIGTFVKAKHEKNEDVNDSSNNSIRVDASEVRARVVGEAANLSFSSAGRIEYSLAGGFCFGDFIDNVAGVNCSDREVNIKIVLRKALSLKVISSEKLHSYMRLMEEEVTKKILHDSYVQSARIARFVDEVVGLEYKIEHAVQFFQKDALLSEYIADLQNVEVPGGSVAMVHNLTKPEAAILMSCCKINLYNQFIAVGSDLFKNKAFDVVLEEYFPKLLLEELHSYVMSHQLRAEIICTILANEFANYLGMTFLEEVMTLANCGVKEVLCAYIVIRNILDLKGVFEFLLDLQNTKPSIASPSDIFTVISESLKFDLVTMIKVGDGVGLLDELVFIRDFLANISGLDVLNSFDRKIFQTKFAFVNGIVDGGIVKKLAVLFSLEDIMICCFAAKKMYRSSMVDFFVFYNKTKEVLSIVSLNILASDGNFDSFSNLMKVSSQICDLLEKRYKLATKVANHYLEPEDFLRKCKEFMDMVKFNIDGYDVKLMDIELGRLVLNDFKNHFDGLLGVL